MVQPTSNIHSGHARLSGEDSFETQKEYIRRDAARIRQHMVGSLQPRQNKFVAVRPTSLPGSLQRKVSMILQSYGRTLLAYHDRLLFLASTSAIGIQPPESMDAALLKWDRMTCELISELIADIRLLNLEGVVFPDGIPAAFEKSNQVRALYRPGGWEREPLVNCVFADSAVVFHLG